MAYQLDMDAETRVLTSHMAPVRKSQVREALHELREDPHLGKPLQEELAGLWSCRVGTFRIIYAIDLAREKVQVVAVGPRKSVYQDLEKQLGVRP